MVKIFSKLFPKPKRLHKEKLDEIKVNILKRFARGNIHLQNGEFTTKQQIDKRKREILNHDF